MSSTLDDLNTARPSLSPKHPFPLQRVFREVLYLELTGPFFPELKQPKNNEELHQCWTDFRTHRSLSAVRELF